MRGYWHLIVILCGLICPPVAAAAVVSYTTADVEHDTTLTSVTVQRGQTRLIYKPETLIPAEVVHFRSAGGVNLACGTAGDSAAMAREKLLDRRLSRGTLNPGAAAKPPTSDPVLTGENPTPGLAVRFQQPIVNRPGPDLLVFELEKGTGGDAFHISPLRFAPGLRGLTVRKYDLGPADGRVVEVQPLDLYRFASQPRTFDQFTQNKLRSHSRSEGGFRAIAVALDLSRLGYAEGALVDGLFFQSMAGVAAFDPVAVLGLPEPIAENLLAKQPLPKPFVPEQAGLLAAVLEGPMAGCEEIIFAQRVSGRDHWYGNFGHYCNPKSPYSNGALIKTDDMRYAFGDGGRLCRFNLRTGELRVLLDDPAGGIRDPNVHYDGRRILFSYRKGGSKAYHLYEINVDGSGLKQLTDGPDNDIEPIYQPDGHIMFCSSRCHRFVPCWHTQVAVLYRCDGDGRNVRMVSNNAEQENTPWMLPDGRVLFMRWEYVDRNQLLYHHLWTVNPDGTAVMVFFGNQHKGLAMLDAKPIPGSDKIVASFSPGHGRAEHMGHITVVDPSGGPDDMSMARRICDRNFRDPYALSANHFLVADKAGIHLLDARGNTQLLFKPAEKGARWDCHEPRPLRPRGREPIVPSRIENSRTTGRLILSDIYEGRNMEGVRRGEIKKLLVLEQLPKPANFSGGQEPLTIGGTFTLERTLGIVPVEPDGSAYMELPALRSLFFVALDENDRSVKRMQSFVTVQPGETTSCLGCHEQRTRAPHSRPLSTLAAVERKPSQIEPFTGLPDVFDYPRDIQPILDRHCVECHSADRREGGVDLSGDRTAMYTVSYWAMFVNGLVSDGRNKYGDKAPRDLGTSASKLMKLIDGSHHDAKLSQREQTMIRLWIESGATYPGTYAALGSGMYPVKYPAAALRRRCGTCHKASKPTYRNPKKGAFYFQFGHREPPQPLLDDVNDIILIRHLAYFQHGESQLYQAYCSLDRPEKSLLIRAPLSRRAGGLELCGQAVFKDTNDPDYQEILGAINDASGRLAEGKRFDMPGFRPNGPYIREMQNYGILPRPLPPDYQFDVHAIDRAYWKSFWHKATARR